MQKLLFLILAAVALMLSCAKDLPPPGGPEDKTPPIIFTTSPLESEIQVATDSRIEIKFSERLEPKSASKAVFISPPLRQEPRIMVKGDRLIIEPAEPLDSNRTYVITIGSSAADLHGNRLRNSLTLAFSTGEIIDSAEISGLVYQDLKPRRDFSLFAYQVDDNLFDSLFQLRPDYITQTGEDGEFHLRNLRMGEYFVIGVEDKDDDNLINSSSERIALPQGFIAATQPDDSAHSYTFHITEYDSSYLHLLNCTGTQGEISLRFTGGPIAEQSMSLDSIAITSASGEGVTPEAIALPPRQGDQVLVWSRGLLPDSSYSIAITGLKNQSGRAMDTAAAVCNVRIGELDQSPPEVIARYPVQGRVIISTDDSLSLTFSEPVEFTSDPTIYIDSVTALPLAPLWQPNNVYKFVVDSSLAVARQYLFQLRREQVQDWFGNQLTDSIYSFTISVADPESLGTLVGEIAADSETSLIVDFEGIHNKLRYRLEQVGGGAFELRMYPDKYLVNAFKDENGNGTWDLGSLDPLEFSEPGWVVSDTLRIRPRFEHSGIRFDFR